MQLRRQCRSISHLPASTIQVARADCFTASDFRLDKDEGQDGLDDRIDGRIDTIMRSFRQRADRRKRLWRRELSVKPVEPGESRLFHHSKL